MLSDSSSQYPKDSLIHHLMKPGSFDHLVTEIELIETHISWIILTGQYAYKIKKPVDLGFLDFSSLEKRHYYCLQEVNLNQRLAPLIYLKVVPIVGTVTCPKVIDDEKEIEPVKEQVKEQVIEYAVKMLQFPQSSQLDRMLEKETLTTRHIDKFAELIADFHQSAVVASGEVEYGNPEMLMKPVEENFDWF